jgi:hypothetical protein
MSEIQWKKGMVVTKIFHGIGGYKEEYEAVVTKVDNKKGIVYVDNETGITFNFQGKENENFFPGMYSEIKPCR